jgi:hypothetical protein
MRISLTEDQDEFVDDQGHQQEQVDAQGREILTPRDILICGLL